MAEGSHAVGLGARFHFNWNSNSSDAPERSCSMLTTAETGTGIRSPLTWMVKGRPASSASARRRKLEMNLSRGQAFSTSRFDLFFISVEWRCVPFISM